MKKIFTLLLCVIILTFAFTTVCFAIESEPSEVTDTPETVTERESVFSRVWEFIDTNKEQIITYAVDIAVLAIIAFTTKYGKKLSLKLVGSISKCASEDTQANIVDALNTMIQELNTERIENLALKEAVSLLKTEIANVHKETRAMFDAMLAVWGNSKNLPQGIKDLLTLTYSNCLKSEKGTSEEVSESDERKAD